MVEAQSVITENFLKVLGWLNELRDIVYSVVTPDLYTAYIKRLKGDIQSAQDRVVGLIQANGGPPGSPSTTSPPAGGSQSAAKQSPAALPGPSSKQAQGGKQAKGKTTGKKQAKGKPKQSGGGGK